MLTYLGVEKLYLTKHRNVFVMSVTDKLDYAKIDKLRQFASIFEGKASKHYAYNSWTQLGGQTDKLMEDMLFAQRRAFDLLRDQVRIVNARSRSSADQLRSWGERKTSSTTQN
jgi:hypothetical protein